MEKRIAWSLWWDDEFKGIVTDWEDAVRVCDANGMISPAREEMTFSRLEALVDEDAVFYWDRMEVA